MSIIEQPFMYFAIFIGFLVVVFLVTRFNKKLTQKYAKQARTSSSLPDIAAKMGLQFEDLSKEPSGKTFFSTNMRIFGEYKGIPIEMIFRGETEQGDTIRPSYKYLVDRKIKLDVTNTNNRSFSIMAKDSNIVGTQTASDSFNKNLIFAGNINIPTEILDYFGSMGWMNLELKGKKLVFNDNYFEQFQGISGGAKMLTATHPIWGCGITGINQVDPDKIIAFVERLIDIVQKSKLS